MKISIAENALNQNAKRSDNSALAINNDRSKIGDLVIACCLNVDDQIIVPR